MALKGAMAMAKPDDNKNSRPVFHMILAGLKWQADGKPTFDRLEMDPSKVEEEKRLLDAAVAAFGSMRSPSTATTPASGKTVLEVVEAFVNEGERSARWTKKTKQEVAKSLTLLCEVLGPNPLSSR